jgi:hypothetical protein
MANAVYRNDGKPTPVAGRPPDAWAPLAVGGADLKAATGLSIAFTPWPDAEALIGGKAAHTAIAVLDVDDDRDLDLVLGADGEPLRVVLNDRLGRFHTAKVKGLESTEPLSGLLVTDFDKDGRADLVGVAVAGSRAWRNATVRTAEDRKLAFEKWPMNTTRWRYAIANDLDLDTWADLVGLPRPEDDPIPAWARNDGKRLTSSKLALGPDDAGTAPLAGFELADVVGDPLPDLFLLREGTAPRVARNLGNGQHWLAVDLSGRWNVRPQHMRTNPQGIGTRLVLEGQGLNVPYDHTTPRSGLAQSTGPVVLGLGKIPTVALIRLRWPDWTMQSELNVAGDKRLGLAEQSRKK